MGSTTLQVEFCPDCCGGVCDFDSATVVISGSTVPCGGTCGTGALGDFEVISGDINGAYELLGSSGSVQLLVENAFVIRLYGIGTGCEGEVFNDYPADLIIGMACYEGGEYPPLGISARILALDTSFYTIFDIGNPSPPTDRFDFGDVVPIPICGGNLTVSL